MDRPDWWRENQRIREDLELPSYEPPRFEDGKYTYEVVDDLEQSYDCMIRFVGIGTRHEDDWEVRIGTESLLQVPHRRDENGNTVFGITAEELRDAVAEHMSA